MFSWFKLYALNIRYVVYIAFEINASLTPLGKGLVYANQCRDTPGDEVHTCAAHVSHLPVLFLDNTN